MANISKIQPFGSSTQYDIQAKYDGNGNEITTTYFIKSSYTIPIGKGVRITYPTYAPVLISCQRSNSGARLILLGGGYGAGGTVRNDFTEVVSCSTNTFAWSIPQSDNISNSIEITNSNDGGNATVICYSTAACTFTAIDTLTSTATNRTLLHSSNYSDYTVTKTGSGATGTWGISINGNAATASRLNISSTDNAIARFDGTNGTIQNSGVIIDDNNNINTTGNIIISKQSSLNWDSNTLPSFQMIGADNKVFKFKYSINGTNIDIGWDYTNGDGPGAAFRNSNSSNNPGAFIFYARKNTSGVKNFIGLPDGTLTWDGRRVVTSTNSTAVGSSTLPIYIDANGYAQTITSYSGNAATATQLSNTPNNTTTFLRGDNTWTNTLTGGVTFQGDTTLGSKSQYYQRSTRGAIHHELIGADADYGAVKIRHLSNEGSGGPGAFSATLGIFDERTVSLSGAHQPVLFINRTGTTTTDLIGVNTTAGRLFTIENSGATSILKNSLYVGTTGDTTAERTITMRGGAGEFYLFSQASTTGTRGIAVKPHGTATNNKDIVKIDTNNNVTFYGTLEGSATKATQDSDGNIITSSYLKRYPWWTSGNGNDIDTLRSGCTFAYSNHNAPNTGTIVAFDCSTNTDYTLQLMGSYGDSNALYFRNRNGDRQTWNSWRQIVYNSGTWAISITGNATTATTAVNSDTVDTKHAEDFVWNGKNNTTLGSGSPASNAKTYHNDTMTEYRPYLTYNSSGVEYTLLFSGRKSYGTILKWSYTDKYIRILRKNNNSWQSDDWEKISSGYADNAGTADKWTTARTLTIGSTGKSVDGSAAVSWSHAEIGATVSNTWTAGTDTGPKISTTVNGVTGTAVAIPTATYSASGVVTTGSQVFGGKKTLKFDTRIYPLLSASNERAQWYKITFPYSTASNSANNWFMNSFDLHFGGGYNANASGVAHVVFYWLKNTSNSWSVPQVSAKMDGILIDKVKLYYRTAEPGILYVNNASNNYNGIWIDNLFVDDTSPSYDWSTTSIAQCAAITESTDPAISAYTEIPTVRTWIDGNNYKIGNNTLPSINNTYSLGSTDYKWANIYATTFHGALDGNASSATKLGTTTIGDAITGFYLKGGTATNLNIDRYHYDGTADWNSYPWHKVATAVMTGSSQERNIKFIVSSGENASLGGILVARVRSEDSSNIGSAQLNWEVITSGVNPALFILTYSGTKAEIWCKMKDRWAGWVFRVLNMHDRIAKTINWTLNDSINGHGSSTYTSGTVVTSTCLSLRQSITGNAATATKLKTGRTFQIKDADSTNAGTASSTFDGSANLIINLPSTIKASITGNCSGSSGSCTGNAATATTATNATNIYSSASTSKAYVLGTLTASSANHGTVYNASVYTEGTVLYGAAWNDYAEKRQVEADEIRPGMCVREIGDDTMQPTTERLQRGCKIISDTYGFCIGETNTAKTPIAVSGRVLAYIYEGREAAKHHIGYGVCSGPNGTVSIMTEEEERMYPMQCIGTISAVPDYETWGENNINVDGRVWIYVR